MEIKYDSKSFIIDGKRKWLFLGEIHYFRFPAAEWREVIRMAKAAGVNTITTYLAWNYHEIEEGVFDFSGDRDFARFIDIAKEEGMYVFLRPGPYICAEWCGGGIPPWILNYEDLELRVDDEIFIRYTEAWYKEAFKYVVPRLITNGGNIIAVQNDNEYPGGWDEKGSSYIQRIYELLKKYGINVPITACNAHCRNGKLTINYGSNGDWKELYKDIIVTYNTAGEASIIPELKAFQPSKPTILTELWTGPQLYWGGQVNDGLLQKSNVCRFTALQSCINLYMFAGGNNYAYYGGNNIATSYASTYPIGEGNLPKAQYYNTKIMGLYISTFADFIAECDYKELNGKDAVLQAASDGDIVYVISDKAFYKYNYKGKEYTVTPGEKGYGMYLHNFKFMNQTVNYSELSVFARADNMLLFVGNAGEKKTITVNGKSYEVFVGYHDTEILDADGIKLIVCDEFMAQRTWITNEGLLIGYDMAYNTENGVYKELKSEREITSVKDGKVKKEVVPGDNLKVFLPQLVDWKCKDAFETIDLRKIDKPMPHHKLNIQHGYVWYKAEADAPKDGYYQMMISAFANRIFVYVNNKFYGIFGDTRNSLTRWDYTNPTNAVREAVPVYLSKGKNEVVFLSEDTGYCFDDVKPMGIMADVYFDTRLCEPKNVNYLGKTPITEQALDYMYSKSVKKMTELNTLEFELELFDDEDVFFIVHGKPCYIYMNGADATPVKPIKHPWQSFEHTVIWASYLSNNKKNKNTVRIQYFCTTNELLSALQMYVVKKDSRLTDWSYSRFSENPEFEKDYSYKNIAKESSTLLVPGGTISSSVNGFTPKYFYTEFKKPDAKRVFLEMGEMKKGQIFLNGHNIGKFGLKITQSLYYLPKDYMKEENELVIFEEYGCFPQSVSLRML